MREVKILKCNHEWDLAVEFYKNVNGNKGNWFCPKYVGR